MTCTLLQRLRNVLAHPLAHPEGQQNPCPEVDPRRRAAVLLALTDEESPRLLMIRRSLHLPTHPGEIAFPGGKHDEGDSDALATALREAWEEVALPPACVGYAGVLEEGISQTDLLVTPVVGVIPPQLTLRAHAGEVAEILYVPLAFFADPKNLRVDRIRWNGEERLTARFQYRHYTIWGLTGRFIVQLANRFCAAGLDIDARAQCALTGVAK